jgi:hypothetical protein
LITPSTAGPHKTSPCRLRLDDHNVSALLGLANAHMWEVNMYVSDDREAQIRAAEAAAAKALSR